MVKLFLHGPQTALDITQAFTVGQLSKSHAKKLIVACKRAYAVVTVITIDTLTKFFLWKKIDYLGENGLALVHNEVPFAFFSAKKPRNQAYGKSKSIPLKFVNI
jgi:hypothetical protein